MLKHHRTHDVIRDKVVEFGRNIWHKICKTLLYWSRDRNFPWKMVFLWQEIIPLLVDILQKLVEVAINFLNRTFSLYKINLGYCPVCEQRALFIARDNWLRDKYICTRCKSIPRFRAIINVLQMHFPAWRSLKIHESSPGGASSEKIARECSGGYIASHFYPDIPPGSTKNGFRCENLEHQTRNQYRCFHFIEWNVLAGYFSWRKKVQIKICEAIIF